MIKENITYFKAFFIKAFFYLLFLKVERWYIDNPLLWLLPFTTDILSSNSL